MRSHAKVRAAALLQTAAKDCRRDASDQAQKKPAAGRPLCTCGHYDVLAIAEHQIGCPLFNPVEAGWSIVPNEGGKVSRDGSDGALDALDAEGLTIEEGRSKAPPTDWDSPIDNDTIKGTGSPPSIEPAPGST